MVREPVRRAAGDHPELHWAQVLGFVDNNVSVGVGAAVDEELGLVEESKVCSCPA